MSDLNKLPYAEWLEQSLHNIIGKPVEAISILIKYEGGTVGTGYYNCSVGDKILFAGYIQQDAMIETLEVNGMVEDIEEDEDENE